MHRFRISGLLYNAMHYIANIKKFPKKISPVSSRAARGIPLAAFKKIEPLGVQMRRVFLED